MLTAIEIHKSYLEDPLIQKFRHSKAAYAYKIGEFLNQGPTFPCSKNPYDPSSKGCHVSGRSDNFDETVLIREKDDVLPEVMQHRLVNSGWSFERREDGFNFLTKEKRRLDKDEWCFTDNCKNRIIMAFLSPLQLKTYELLRSESLIIEDINYNKQHKRFYEYLCTLSTYPKIVRAIQNSDINKD